MLTWLAGWAPVVKPLAPLCAVLATATDGQ
jgi:hypothetical protein